MKNNEIFIRYFSFMIRIGDGTDVNFEKMGYKDLDPQDAKV